MTAKGDEPTVLSMFTIPSGAPPSLFRLRRTMSELRAIKSSFGL
jgi:hypothetical protein